MKCSICNRNIENKGAFANHMKTCEIINRKRKEIIHLYTVDYISIKKLARKFKLGTETIRKILGNKIRTLSESMEIARKLYPESYKLTDKQRNKLRKARLRYMKENPEKTAWRKANMSYPEKRIFNKIKELKLNETHLIVREYSVFPYFIDFAFVNEKVALEIDGSQHLLEERMESDQKKDSLLSSKGWRVLRITAKEVNERLDGVIVKLLDFIKSDTKCENFGMISYSEYKATNVKKSYTKENRCLNCNKKITNRSKVCIKCDHLSQRTVTRPPYDQLLKEIQETNYSAVGRKYDVSDNAIRKWVKYYEKNNQ